jgi:hypothetical protein
MRVRERRPTSREGSDTSHQKAAHGTGRNPSAICIARAGEGDRRMVRPLRPAMARRLDALEAFILIPPLNFIQHSNLILGMNFILDMNC